MNEVYRSQQSRTMPDTRSPTSSYSSRSESLPNSPIGNLPDEIFTDDEKDGKFLTVKRVLDKSGRQRRIYSAVHKDPKKSTRRFRANDRERRRMDSLNGALQALKECIPTYSGKKRMTKLQVLKYACLYISDLSDILCADSFVGQHHQGPLENFNMADIQQACMATDDHYGNALSMFPGDVNGLNIMQRIDYLTYHDRIQQQHLEREQNYLFAGFK